MDVLVIGGTQFVGRYLVAALLERGHDVTCFHRGETNPDLFPEVARVFGDRTSDLDRLGDRRWDVVVDTCGYTPEHVELAVDALVGRADRYVFVSSMAAYEPTSEPGIDETAPLQTDPPAGDGVAWWHTAYARNKAACEAVVRDAFGEDDTLVVRPGMLMGPHDPVRYFTYWVARLHAGGDVLVPDVRDQPLQFLDARDLGAFAARLVDRGTPGAFTVDGPPEPTSFGALIETVRDTVGGTSTLHWVEPEWLLDRDVRPPWEKLPYWLPGDAAHGYCRKSVAKAVEHGLTHRPLADSVADTLAWYDRTVGFEDEAWVEGVVRGDRGLPPEEEAELLEAYRAA